MLLVELFIVLNELDIVSVYVVAVWVDPVKSVGLFVIKLICDVDFDVSLVEFLLVVNWIATDVDSLSFTNIVDVITIWKLDIFNF